MVSLGAVHENVITSGGRMTPSQSPQLAVITIQLKFKLIELDPEFICKVPVTVDVNHVLVDQERKVSPVYVHAPVAMVSVALGVIKVHVAERLPVYQLFIPYVL